MEKKLSIIKSYLSNHNIDAWVIYDYECHNDALISLIGKRFLTRKIYLVVPKDSKPYLIAHEIDTAHLNDALILDNFDIKKYKTYNELFTLLKDNLSVYKSALMEMSDNGDLPRSSYCDYGTIVLIKKFIKNIYSSADLLMLFNSTYYEESFNLQKEAMNHLLRIVKNAFKFIEFKLKNNEKVNEYDVSKFITNEFDKADLEYDSNPIVAINSNASNPHYEPTESHNSLINKGDMILIDLWAKRKEENAVYADITWMGYAGKYPSENHIKTFNVLKESITAGLNFLNANLSKGIEIKGYQVDDSVRNILKNYNLDAFLIHRVGHSISIDNTPHGKGVNIDNYETHDTRSIINNIGFSIEPGIYMKDFGYREEIDVYITNNKAVSVGERQEEIITMDLD